MTKAVALLSGGLDSTLAVKLMIDQGIEVHALNFTSAFCTCNHGGAREGGCKSESKKVADRFGIPIKVMLKGLDYMELVRRPMHGRGKGMNPCVDCRIFMFRKAKEYMEEIGASFVITGEVIGQRPMSQRLDAFRVIERESGLEGLILRPLCALELEPTIPEKTGLVDREKLMGVHGRSRKELIGLAEDLDINDYPCPSGGCLLTDKIFSKKVKDLLDHKADVTTRDLSLLKAGRHFRFNGVKIVIGKNEADNQRVRSLAASGDTIVEPDGFAGPVALVDGSDELAVEFAGRLIMRYANEKAGDAARLKVVNNGASAAMDVAGPAAEGLVEEARVC